MINTGGFKFFERKTFILGSGAAGLAAAVRLAQFGETDFAVVTEGLQYGTSINAGSDKQTYYKLNLSGAEGDSPRQMAETYTAGGCAHGDIALVEAANSARAFEFLVELGVPFPHDSFGQFTGYKTDHDPRQRATSCGPYTSREMCRALIREARRRNVEFIENRVVVRIIVENAPPGYTPDVYYNQSVAPSKGIQGFIAVNMETGELEMYKCDNLVLALGGPAGIYKRSAYPEGSVGGLGLAFEIGAASIGLGLCQFGLASFTDVSNRVFPCEKEGAAHADPDEVQPVRPQEFRWNVSGSYMQVIPRFVSTDADGVSGEREFLKKYFKKPNELFTRIFQKGYQWPFDAKKAQEGGSSLIDLAVYYETEVLGRRVFLDYSKNPEGLDLKKLEPEPRDYLRNSGALGKTPFERLQELNPDAIKLYADHAIDLEKEKLEIAVCMQHCNGGLAVDPWYRSTNTRGLYVIGEAAGTHGIARPGGSALNAGQVGALRVAQHIANAKPTESTQGEFVGRQAAMEVLQLVVGQREMNVDWKAEREIMQKRMSKVGGIFRPKELVKSEGIEGCEQFYRLRKMKPLRELPALHAETSINPLTMRLDRDDVERLRTMQLLITHNIMLMTMNFEDTCGCGSRGSQLTQADEGFAVSTAFPKDWIFDPENEEMRGNVIMVNLLLPHGLYKENPCSFVVAYAPARGFQKTKDWFENVWKEYREGEVWEEFNHGYSLDEWDFQKSTKGMRTLIMR